MNSELIFNDKDKDVFELILDNIPDYITIVDSNCKTVFFNKACERYYNITKDEIIGKDIRDFFPNSLLPKVIEQQKSYDNIYNSPRENSYTVISAVPLYNSDGKLIGGLARDRDITELVKLSNVLNKTQANLSRLEKTYSLVEDGQSYFSNIIGKSPLFIQTVNLCKNVSKTPMNILLRGESGTGKELFAKAIHYESDREGDFVAINCSAIPSELFESELFGYDEGAFTGAKKDGKIGKFEEANGGTLFLDEIGDMPMELQPKILRALEEGFITRIGSNIKRPINVRIISATNKDVRSLINENKFRRDLYYRLDAFQIDIPPLRKRGNDIILLANTFLQQFCMEQRMNIMELSKEVEDIFLDQIWEGNVRELRNAVQRSAIFAFQDRSDKIKKRHLPDLIIEGIENKKTLNRKVSTEEGTVLLDLEGTVERLEKEMIQQALLLSNNNILKAAKILQIPRTTLYYKIEKYKLDDK